MVNRSILAAVALLAFPCAAAPIITFQANRIDVTNLTPGATVALMGVQQEADPDHLKTRTFEAPLTDDDRDGVVHFDVRTGVKATSIWVVAEIGGGITAASPNGDHLLTDLPGSALRSPESIAIRGDLLEVLYFRPQVGAWRQTVVDSGAKDVDGQPDGAATISFTQLNAVGDAPPSPGRYAPGDVLIAINPLDLTGYELSAGN